MSDARNGAGAVTAPPALASIGQESLKDYWEVYDAHYEAITADLTQAAVEHPDFGPILRKLGPAQLAEQNKRSYELQARAILHGEWEPYLTDLRTQGAHYAQMGTSFTGWFEIVGAYRTQMMPRLLAAYSSNPDRLLSAMNGMNAFIDQAMAVIGQEYLRTKEQIIGFQQEAIHELSTPVLQVREQLLILPIIGMIDTQRARQLTEQLLRGIRANRARVVVMDITGVPTVDSRVANHLVQTVEASRLMGATVIVTGLSAEVAQALVTIGVDLSKMNTMGDLQSGLEQAEALLGYSVRKESGAGEVSLTNGHAKAEARRT